MITETLSMRACHESRRGSSTAAPPRCGSRRIRFDASASPRKHPRTTDNCFASHRLSTSTRAAGHAAGKSTHLQRSTRAVVKVLAWPALRLQPPNAPNPKVGVEHVGPLEFALEKPPLHALYVAHVGPILHELRPKVPTWSQVWARFVRSARREDGMDTAAHCSPRRRHETPQPMRQGHQVAGWSPPRAWARRAPPCWSPRVRADVLQSWCLCRSRST